MSDLNRIADGREEIRLSRPGSDFQCIVGNALYRPNERRSEAAAQRDRVVPQTRGYWYLPEAMPGTPAELRSDPQPQSGDRIFDAAGNDWFVERVVHSLFARTWRCVVSRYAVPFGLDEYVDYLETVYEKSESGVLHPGYRVLRSGVAAKFSETVVAYDRASEVLTRSFYLITPERSAPGREGVVRRGNGTLWRILQGRLACRDGEWSEFLLQQLESSLSPI